MSVSSSPSSPSPSGRGTVLPSYEVCGVRCDAHQIPSASTAILSWAGSGQGRAVHLVNAGTLSLARHDANLTDLLSRADLNLTDGMPLVWIARRLGLDHMRERVYGPDLMLAVLEQGVARGVRHYLYGSTPEVVEQLATSLRGRFEGLRIVGVESPPFRPLSAEEKVDMANRVRASGADIVWVGLGTPRQDVFVDEFRDQLGATLIAVGAAFDFHSGNKKQAPAWMQKAGLEWLHRLGSEPRRLWKRYLVGNTQFVWAVMRDKPRLLPPRSA
jgi:N-acetylglucosaminyldiphosphoundecaprenol N-acetyl-beta-D-mannosaminyltransferase